MIIEGTTPELQFNIPYNLADISKCFVTISKPYGSTIKEYTIGDPGLSISNKLVTLNMTQDETFAISKISKEVEIQITLKTINGKVVKSKMMTGEFTRSLKKEVI